MNKCPHPECTLMKPNWRYACREHWLLLPSPIKEKIVDGHTRDLRKWVDGHKEALNYWKIEMRRAREARAETIARLR